MLSRTVGTVRPQGGALAAVCPSLLAVFSMFLFTVSGLAQTTAGRILGSITGQSGAAVAGAAVVVTDAQRGIARTCACRKPRRVPCLW